MGTREAVRSFIYAKYEGLFSFFYGAFQGSSSRNAKEGNAFAEQHNSHMHAIRWYRTARRMQYHTMQCVCISKYSEVKLPGLYKTLQRSATPVNSSKGFVSESKCHNLHPHRIGSSTSPTSWRNFARDDGMQSLECVGPIL